MYLRYVRLHGFGAVRALLLLLDNDGMIWVYAQGQVTIGCGKMTLHADVARVGRTLPLASSGVASVRRL